MIVFPLESHKLIVLLLGHFNVEYQFREVLERFFYFI